MLRSGRILTNHRCRNVAKNNSNRRNEKEAEQGFPLFANSTSQFSRPIFCLLLTGCHCRTNSNRMEVTHRPRIPNTNRPCINMDETHLPPTVIRDIPPFKPSTTTSGSHHHPTKSEPTACPQSTFPGCASPRASTRTTRIVFMDFSFTTVDKILPHTYKNRLDVLNVFSRPF